LRLIMVADGTCDYPDDRQGALHALHLLARLGDRAAVDFLAGSSAGLAAPSGSFV
jgi:1,4-dihydroxy-2-naphthoate octaprenyltransferase